MRIVHLSDTHFSAENLNSFEQYYIDAIRNDLAELNAEKKIDAVCITGDLIDKGGSSFDTTGGKYEYFMQKFWNPIAEHVGIPSDNVYFIPGNHDVNRKFVNEIDENGIKASMTSIEKINNYIETYKNDNHYGFKRLEEYKAFERSYYDNQQHSVVTNFEACHILDLPIGRIGIACINTAWRCSSDLPDNELVFGTAQISRASKYLRAKGCKYMIALMHHPIDVISPIEKDESMSMLRAGKFDAVLFGHIHHGKSHLEMGNQGSLFISTARTGFSKPTETIEKYRSGYTILDFDFEKSIVTCLYRKYIHDRNEFDKDTDLARGGQKIYSLPAHNMNAVGNFQSTQNPESAVAVQAISLSDTNSGDIEQRDNLAKAVELYIQQRNSLDYNSSKDDFGLVKRLEKEIYNAIELPFDEKIKNIPALKAHLIQSLFERIYTSESFDSSIIKDVQTVRIDKITYNWYERKVIINAITLSLLTHRKFSPQKADILIDFLTDFEDIVWESSLVGLVLSLLHNQNRWERFDFLKKRLATLKEIPNVQDGLYNIEQILQNELYKQTFFNKNIYNLDFFNNPLNCFLPFYKDNPVLTSALDSGELGIDTLRFQEDMESMPFPDTYKYALSLAAQTGEVERKSLAGKDLHRFRIKLHYADIFSPYQNLVTEFYTFLSYYPKSTLKNIFSNSWSISQHSLKSAILNKSNELDITADKQMQNGEFNAAIKTLNDLLRLEPTSYSANWKSAICFVSLKTPNFFQALKFLEVLYVTHPADSRVMLLIADCYNGLENKEKQKEFIDNAFSKFPENRNAIIEYARFERLQDHWTESIEILKKGLRLYPNDITLNTQAGKSYYAMKDFENSLMHGRLAENLILANDVEDKDLKDDAYTLIGDSMLMKFDFENALKYAQLIVELEDTGENIMNLGRAYLFSGKENLPKAKQLLNKAFKKYKSNVCYGNLGHLELLLGNRENALINYSQSINLFKDYHDFAKSMKVDEALMINAGINIDEYNSIQSEVIKSFEAQKRSASN